MKSYKLKIGPIVLFAVLAVCLLIGGISARYSMERNNPKNVIDTNAFYFNSDLLKDAADDVSYTVAGNTTTMTFSLYNFEDELRYSETDIYYELAITGGTATLSIANGTLTEDAKSSQVITISGMENGQTYVVTAHGHSLPNTGSGEGYQKDLKITLNVANATSSIEKILNDYTDYVELDVWTTGTIYGAMQITYPTGLIPDNTDSAMVGWETSTTSAITKNDGISFMNTYSSHRYRFFKVNPADTFNKNNFTVQIIAP